MPPAARRCASCRLHGPRGDADGRVLAGLPRSRLGPARRVGGARAHGHPRDGAAGLLAGAGGDGGGACSRSPRSSGHLGGGWAGDRISKRAIVVGCMVGHATALLLLAAASAYWMVVVFAIAPRPLVGHPRAADGGHPGRLLRKRGVRDDLRDLVDGLDAGDDGRAARRGDPGRPDRQLPARLHGARRFAFLGSFFFLLARRPPPPAVRAPIAEVALPILAGCCHPSGLMTGQGSTGLQPWPLIQ